jgi:hypothetical protein
VNGVQKAGSKGGAKRGLQKGLGHKEAQKRGLQKGGSQGGAKRGLEKKRGSNGGAKGSAKSEKTNWGNLWELRSRERAEGTCGVNGKLISSTRKKPTVQKQVRCWHRGRCSAKGSGIQHTRGLAPTPS